jgi:O-antigen ligase
MDSPHKVDLAELHLERRIDRPQVSRDIRTYVESSGLFARVTLGGMVWFSVFLLAGFLAVLYPFVALGSVAVLGALGFARLAFTLMRGAGLEAWQVLLLIALTGYTLLNYGFENLTFHLGLPIILSYVLMFGSLAFAAFSHPELMIRAWKEPAMICISTLLVLTTFHLIIDIPSYGIWAIRDASMFVDGIFLALGLLWAMKVKSTIPLMKWLMVLFVVNMVYSFTFPWAEKIAAWSPSSGVFLQVPIFGNYRGNAIYLLLGAVFFILLGRYVVGWPRWVMLSLAGIQLSGLAIHQARALYVGLMVILVILIVTGHTGKATKLAGTLLAGFAAVLLITTMGVEIQGRVGPVKADFLREHLRSISGAEGTPGASVEGRFDWYEQVFERIRRHPVVGEGFGQVLINFTNDLTGGAVRQPHNSTVSVLARLGAIGLIPWLIFHGYFVKRCLYAFRQRRYCDKQFSDFLLWLFVVYVIFVIEACVEPAFEFPSGAIPFYFFVGLALGLIRWQLPQLVRSRFAEVDPAIAASSGRQSA